MKKVFLLFLLVANLSVFSACDTLSQDQKYAALLLGKPNLEQVIKVLGKPDFYMYNYNRVEKNELHGKPYYDMIYLNHAHLKMINNQLAELKFEMKNYSFMNGIMIDDTLDTVISKIGPPNKTILNSNRKDVMDFNTFQYIVEDGVLHKDFSGWKGQSLYQKENMLLYFRNNKVYSVYIKGSHPIKSEIFDSGPIEYVITDNYPVPYSRMADRGVLARIPQFNPYNNRNEQVDLRGFDLSNLDLTTEYDNLICSYFNTYTIWSSSMPQNYNPTEIMNIAKKLGPGIRKLHKKGITGKGVSIAIIDQPLLRTHVEYRDRIVHYEEINNNMLNVARTHASNVTTIAAGKTLGVAPDVKIYYFGAFLSRKTNSGYITDYRSYAKAIERVVEINQSLPEDKKIRVISTSINWYHKTFGAYEMFEAIKKAHRDNIFVVSGALFHYMGLRTLGLGRHPYSDPLKFESYEPSREWKRGFGGYLDPRYLLIPSGSMLVASPAGDDGYSFMRFGVTSWYIPYLAGVYALALQVDPELSSTDFWYTALKTGKHIKYNLNGKEISFGPIINPEAIIQKIDD